MFKTRILTRGALFGALTLPFYLLGCSGGGGGGNGGNGGPSPTATPRAPTPTPVGLNRIVFRLNDGAGNAVDGLVTIGGFTRATVGGEAIFSGFVPRSYSATIVVNGVTSTRAFVATAGTTTVVVAINANSGPQPTATPPAPPF